MNSLAVYNVTLISEGSVLTSDIKRILVYVLIQVFSTVFEIAKLTSTVFWFLWPLESSGSSSDDTVCSSSMAIKPAAAESSDLPAVRHVTTGPQPERLSSEVGDTFMCPQFARGRRLLSGYYAPTSIVSVSITVLKMVM
jgi:hypothetical protein